MCHNYALIKCVQQSVFLLWKIMKILSVEEACMYWMKTTDLIVPATA
jgi:hypothetical protein